MTTITRIAGAGLIAAAFLGFAGGGMAHAAAAYTAETATVTKSANGIMLTQAFYIRNDTSFEMRLQDIDGAGANDGKPAINTVLLPGQSMRYEKVFWFGNTPATTLRFTYWTPGGQIISKDVKLIIDNLLNAPRLELFDDSGQPIVTKAEYFPTHTDAIFSDRADRNAPSS